MSRQLGLEVLKPSYRGTRIPVMEHFGALSRETIVALAGRDPLAEGSQAINEIYQQVGRTLDVDLNWGGGLPGPDSEVFDWSDGQTVKRNRHGLTCVQWGVFGTVHAEDGRHYHHIPKPETVDAALDFDPAPWFPESVEQLTRKFTLDYERMLQRCGDVCCPLPHHYTTAFHFPLAIFGFELLCEAGLEESRFSRLMERFAAVSHRITTAWSRVKGLAGFILHDDLTITSGPIFPPAWYRRHIFPHYRAIFQPLLDRNIPIIFTTDGDCTEFVGDIFEAGADGLNFEHLVDLAMLVERYPDKLLIGNLNSAVLAAGPVSAITNHTHTCIETGAKARRFVVNVGGQLTHDIPTQHLLAYLEARKALCRRTRNRAVAIAT